MNLKEFEQRTEKLKLKDLNNNKDLFSSQVNIFEFGNYKNKNLSGFRLKLSFEKLIANRNEKAAKKVIKEKLKGLDGYNDVEASKVANTIFALAQEYYNIKVGTIGKIEDLKEAIPKQNTILYAANVYLSYLQNIQENKTDSKEIQDHIKLVEDRITIISNSSMTSEELNAEIDKIFAAKDVTKWYDYIFPNDTIVYKDSYEQGVSELRNLLKSGNPSNNELNEVLSSLGQIISNITGKLDRKAIADKTLGVKDASETKPDKDYGFDTSESGIKEEDSPEIKELFDMMRSPMSIENLSKDDLFADLKNGKIWSVIYDLKQISKNNQVIGKITEDDDWLEDLAKELKELQSKQEENIENIKTKLKNEKILLEEEVKRRPNDNKLKDSLTSITKIIDNDEDLSTYANAVFQSSMDLMIIQTIGHKYMSHVIDNDKTGKLKEKYSLYTDIIGTGFLNPSDGDLTNRFNITQEVVMQLGLAYVSFGVGNAVEGLVTSGARKLIFGRLINKLIPILSGRAAVNLGKATEVLLGLGAKAGTYMFTNDALQNIKVGEDWDHAIVKAWEDATMGKFIGDFALFGVFKALAYFKIFLNNAEINEKLNIGIALASPASIMIGAANFFDRLNNKDLEVTNEEFVYLFAILILIKKTGLPENFKLDLSRFKGVLHINGKPMETFAKSIEGLKNSLNSVAKIGTPKLHENLEYIKSFGKGKNKNILVKNKDTGNNQIINPKGEVIVEYNSAGNLIREPFPGEIGYGRVNISIVPKGFEEFSGINWRIPKDSIKELTKLEKGKSKIITLYSENGYTTQVEGKIIMKKVKNLEVHFIRVSNNKRGYVDTEFNPLIHLL